MTVRGAPTRPMRYVDLSDVLNQKIAAVLPLFL